MHCIITINVISRFHQKQSVTLIIEILEFVELVTT